MVYNKGNRCTPITGMLNCIVNCKKINKYSNIILNISYNHNYVFSDTGKNVHFSNQIIRF